MFYRDCEGVCASIDVFFYFALAILLAVLAVWVAIDLGLFGNCLIESMHRAAFCTIRNSCGASNCLRTTLLILKHLSELVSPIVGMCWPAAAVQLVLMLLCLFFLGREVM